MRGKEKAKWLAERFRNASFMVKERKMSFFDTSIELFLQPLQAHLSYGAFPWWVWSFAPLRWRLLSCSFYECVISSWRTFWFIACYLIREGSSWGGRGPLTSAGSCYRCFIGLSSPVSSSTPLCFREATLGGGMIEVITYTLCGRGQEIRAASRWSKLQAAVLWLIMSAGGNQIDEYLKSDKWMQHLRANVIEVGFIWSI